ncbi:MAG: hypothetical protein WCO06_00860 [Candidatus Roizmanbacteria bacterium]
MDTFEIKLKKKLENVYELKPHSFGVPLLDVIYKRSTGSLKKNPFILFIPVSIFCGILMYSVFGSLIVSLVSRLQYGF